MVQREILMTDNNLRRSASFVLGVANKAVTTERGEQHGPADAQFSMTAEFWTVYIRNKMRRDNVENVYLSSHDVALMMDLLKTTRITWGDASEADHYADKAGYTAIGAAIAGVKVPPPSPFPPAPIPDASTVSLAKKFAPRPDPIPETKSVVVPSNADMSKVLDQLAKDIVE
jgi:hypothetical protein